MFKRFPKRSVAANSTLLNIFSFFVCLRLYWVVAVISFAHATGSYALGLSVLVIANLAQMAFEVPTGILSDRFGRVWSLRVGAVASLVCVLFYAAGSNYAWLVVGALFNGLFEAAISGTDEALLYESVPEGGEFHRHLGSLNMSREVGGFIAAVLSGVVAAWGFEWGFWLTAAVQVPAIAVSFMLTEPTKHTVQADNVWRHLREALGLMRRNATLRRLSLADIIEKGCSTFSLWTAFYSLFMPIQAAGAMISLNFLQSAIGFKASGWVVSKWQPPKVMLASGVWSRALMWPALLVPGPWSPFMMAAGGASYGPETVAKGVLLHAEFTDHQRATMASIASLLGNALFAVFAIGTGVVADTYGVRVAIICGHVCLIAIFWLHWRVYRDHKR